jgi:hypothetical protein
VFELGSHADPGQVWPDGRCWADRRRVVAEMPVLAPSTQRRRCAGRIAGRAGLPLAESTPATDLVADAPTGGG